MLDEDERKEKHIEKDAEDIKEILSVVSTEVPALIKNVMASVFSEEAGRSMGKAAVAFYAELKDSGMPNDVAVKMTEEYMSSFTSLGGIIRQIGKGEGFSSEKEKELERKISRRVREKLKKKGLLEEEE